MQALWTIRTAIAEVLLAGKFRLAVWFFEMVSVREPTISAAVGYRSAIIMRLGIGLRYYDQGV
jgi:hypothetical protein